MNVRKSGVAQAAVPFRGGVVHPHELYVPFLQLILLARSSVLYIQKHNQLRGT
jgi:hypothetical protein